MPSSEKRSKIDADCSDLQAGMQEAAASLSDFEFKELLMTDPQRKFAAAHLIRKNVDAASGLNAILLMDKKCFTEQSISKYFCSEEVDLTLHFSNDIYNKGDLTSKDACAVTLIYPATEKHFEKYRQQQLFVVKETYDDYLRLTLPHIESCQMSLQWVYNVLEHKAEADRILFEDPHPETGFLLAPDLKWDGKSVENLYYTAICFRRDLRSLRDLTSEHLPLLENIFNAGTREIRKRWNLADGQLRIYVHYQPSYYHLHVHFNHINFEAPGITAGKAHLLADVIDNLRLLPGYYQRKPLYFALRASDPLLSKLTAAHSTPEVPS